MSKRDRPEQRTVRERVPAATETNVLHATRRRCCLCVRLSKDYGIKRLQLAHIDRNRGNSALDNLAPLCLLHHDEYDSVSHQTKRMKPGELREYLDSWLHEASSRYPSPSSRVQPAPNRNLAAVLRAHPTFRVIRRTPLGEKVHETLDLHLHGSYLTVTSAQWTSVGPLRGTQFVARFKYHRGESSKDLGTHDLTWNGQEFEGSVQFDHPEWGSADLVWRPISTPQAKGAAQQAAAAADASRRR